MTGRWHALLEGLLRPTAGTLSASLVVALVGVAGWSARLGEADLAQGWSVQSWDDEFAALAGEVCRMRQQPPPAGGTWVIGSSATREALSSPEALAGALRRYGKRGPVRLFAAGGLYAEEALVLVEALPIAEGDLVLIELSARNLALPADELQGLLTDPRLPLHGVALDRVAQAQGLVPTRRVAGSSLLSYPAFWLPRMGGLVHLLVGAPEVDLHLVDRLGPVHADRALALAARLGDWARRCGEAADLHRATYRAIGAELQRKGARLVLLEAPRNPAMWAAQVAAEPGLEAAAEACLAAVETDLGRPRIDPIRGADLPPGAFRDHAHLGDAGARRIYTAALAAAIGTLP